MSEPDHMNDSLTAAVARLRNALDRPTLHDITVAVRRECDPETVGALLSGLEAAQRERDAWRAALDPVMPPDFKDWHENNPAELPEIAAWVITNLRERVAELEANGVHSCHPECPRPLCVAQRRIAELEAGRAQAIAEAVEVALDPRVSSDAQALIDRGAAQASPPLALLVRDIANDLGVKPLIACRALEAMGFGQHSVNMAVTADMARALRDHFHSQPTHEAAQASTGARPLTDEQIWKSDDIMSINAAAGLHMPTLMRLVRAIERAQGIGQS